MWQDFERTDRFGSMGAGFIDIGKRDRKATSYSEQAYFKAAMDGTKGEVKPKVHRAKEVMFYDYQFFDEEALRCTHPPASDPLPLSPPASLAQVPVLPLALRMCGSCQPVFCSIKKRLLSA